MLREVFQFILGFRVLLPRPLKFLGNILHRRGQPGLLQLILDGQNLRLAGVIFAVIFLSIVGAIYVSYTKNSAKADFESKAQELAERIDILAGKDLGTKEFFDINVPPDCELRFENNLVVAVVDGNPENHNVGVQVCDNRSAITNGMVTLTLERTENGVTING